MRRRLSAILALLAGSATAALADEGRIPIFKPTTITKSGSYVLTRDIEVASGTIITVQASNVTLDLDGKTLQVGAPDPIIVLDTGASTFRVEDGRLIGGRGGIEVLGAVGPLHVEARNLDFLDPSNDAINISTVAGEVTVSDCTFRRVGNSGISFSSVAASSAVRISANVFSDIQNRSVMITNVRSVAILDNVVSETANGFQISFSFSAAPGGSDIVKGNILEHRTIVPVVGDGIVINNVGAGAHRTALVLDNVVSGFTRGMLLVGDGFRVAGNAVHRGTNTGGLTGDGVVLLSATQSLIEGNQIQGNVGCGLVLGAGTSANAYRNNMLRGNGGGTVCNTGAGNTDAGGNIF